MKSPYSILYFILGIICILSLFFFVNKENNDKIYNSSFSGLILNKVQDKNDHNIWKFILLMPDKKTLLKKNIQADGLWEEAKIGDSIIKKPNSYVYRLIKIKGKDTLFDDFHYKP